MTSSVTIGQSPIPTAANLIGVTLTGDQGGFTVNIPASTIAGAAGPYPLYTITGYTATPPGSETAVANYATIAEFEAAVSPTHSGQRCQIAGYPVPWSYGLYEALWNGTAYEWGPT